MCIRDRLRISVFIKDKIKKQEESTMTKLDCNVTGCLHNSENCCCKNVIVVEGQTAREKCDTCCGSYDENKGGMFRNMFKTPENRLEVECEAVNLSLIHI